ncbi:MAG: hypothetical protein AAB538_00450 [Patescibacteria group bacterium]
MKRAVYTIAFTVLGILLQFLAHAVAERWYIMKLVKDFETYGLGLSWDQWFLVHHVSAAVLLIAGAAFGFWQGRFWWPRLYDEQGNKRWHWKRK